MFVEGASEDDVVAGEVISCPDCSADLEVTAVKDDKVEVEPAEMSEEDWGE